MSDPENLLRYVELLRSRGLERLPSATKRAAAAGLDRAEEWLIGQDLLSEDQAAVVKEGLVGLRDVVPHLGTLSRTLAGGVLAHAWRGGGLSRADLELEAASLEFAERLAAQQAGSLTVLREELAEDHAWGEIAATLRAIGEQALRAAIPLLIAAL